MRELTEIKGVGPVLAKACVDNGFDNVERVAAAMLHDLIAVPGINEAKARLVIAAAQDLLKDAPAPSAEAAPPEDAAASEAAAGPATESPGKEKARKRKAKKDKKKKDKKKSKKDSKKKKRKKSKKGKKS